jgi:hypothetical protein
MVAGEANFGGNTTPLQRKLELNAGIEELWVFTAFDDSIEVELRLHRAGEDRAGSYEGVIQVVKPGLGEAVAIEGVCKD